MGIRPRLGEEGAVQLGWIFLHSRNELARATGTCVQAVLAADLLQSLERRKQQEEPASLRIV
ncbi:hypothetical protein BE15_14260 [Sorangium cellulosum]|uniref:Uncharacterized protein n=1 Tax=Sorangium cellulosum TaxID=56 RepID=A0A150QQA5_SORCE|nr:hypothetical protein BE15_14260 [Sorangium cellulosum]